MKTDVTENNFAFHLRALIDSYKRQHKKIAHIISYNFYIQKTSTSTPAYFDTNYVTCIP